MTQCPYCNSTKLRKQGFSKNRQSWKCQTCGRKHTQGARLRKLPEASKVVECKNCGTETTNPKFCSMSCSAIYNNYKHTKRYQTRKQNHPARKFYCHECGVQVGTGRKKCDDCHRKNPRKGGIPKSLIDWDNITLSDVADRATYQVHAQIRQRARFRYRKSTRPKYCVNCGYDKHIEICHIQAIADFTPETSVAEINDLKNLVALCPNCHWELDNGELQIEDIRGKNNAID